MNRFIGYKNVVAIVWIIISITMLGLSVFGLIKLIKWRKSDKYDDSYLSNDGIFFGCILTTIIILIISFFIVLACNTQGLIQNIFIPELSILDYITYYGGM